MYDYTRDCPIPDHSYYMFICSHVYILTQNTHICNYECVHIYIHASVYVCVHAC